MDISLSQTRASHNKPNGFGTERATFGDETISVASYFFQKNSSANIEQHECCVNYCDFRGSFGHFYALIEFFNAFYVHNSNLNYMHILQYI